MRTILSALLFFLLEIFSIVSLKAQDPWIITATKIDLANYYGITVANGMIGIVSSPEPFKVKDVVLAGTYDQYGRGRVSNFLHSFNLLNGYLEIDGRRVSATNTANLKQELNMHQA
ncbi:MAG: glycoside hydrolase family 65 protein, partial [Flavisolibacter sp.]|nr:glycoside hydrolase family 65 protein [Flavisolibacter sp.]